MIATGEQHSVREFVDASAQVLGMRLEWHGAGIEETAVLAEAAEGCEVQPGAVVVRVDPAYFRPTEVTTLLGDARKAREKLGWVASISFGELVEEMTRADLHTACRDRMVKQAGYCTYDYHE